MEIKVGDSVCAMIVHHGNNIAVIGIIDMISKFHPRYHIVWNDGDDSWEDSFIEEFRYKYLDLLAK